MSRTWISRENLEVSRTLNLLVVLLLSISFVITAAPPASAGCGRDTLGRPIEFGDDGCPYPDRNLTPAINFINAVAEQRRQQQAAAAERESKREQEAAIRRLVDEAIREEFENRVQQQPQDSAPSTPQDSAPSTPQDSAPSATESVGAGAVQPQAPAQPTDQRLVNNAPLAALLAPQPYIAQPLSGNSVQSKMERAARQHDTWLEAYEDALAVWLIERERGRGGEGEFAWLSELHSKSNNEVSQGLIERESTGWRRTAAAGSAFAKPVTSPEIGPRELDVFTAGSRFVKSGRPGARTIEQTDVSALLNVKMNLRLAPGTEIAVLFDTKRNVDQRDIVGRSKLVVGTQGWLSEIGAGKKARSVVIEVPADVMRIHLQANGKDVGRITRTDFTRPADSD